MRRLLALAVILLVAAGALYLAQRRKSADAVSANLVVNVAADLQRDVTQVPMHITRISDDEEVRIGDELVRRYGFQVAAPAAGMSPEERYLNAVGERVAAQAMRRLHFHFHLDPNPDLINAFALPGGHVFVGQGLLNQMNSEDELAFVLGHEIEHIDHYHSVERVQIEAQLHNLSLDVFAAVAEIPLDLWQAGYSKDEEFEADREGLRIAAAAGYAPQGALDMLAQLNELDQEYVIHAQTPAGELSQLAIQGLMGYFRSHPLGSERLAQAKAVIAQDHLDLSRARTPLRIDSSAESEKALGNP
jgi:beta-barrel assembly-enhancing protease